jgi:hypothetical protein
LTLVIPFQLVASQRRKKHQFFNILHLFDDIDPLDVFVRHVGPICLDRSGVLAIFPLEFPRPESNFHSGSSFLYPRGKIHGISHLSTLFYPKGKLFMSTWAKGRYREWHIGRIAGFYCIDLANDFGEYAAKSITFEFEEDRRASSKVRRQFYIPK